MLTFYFQSLSLWGHSHFSFRESLHDGGNSLKRVGIVLLAGLVLFGISFCFVGCQTGQFKGKNGQTEMTQAGIVAKAGTVETTKGKMTLPIAANSEIRITPAESTTLSGESETTRIKGPESFAPPSPVELARGLVTKWALIASGILVVASLVLFWASFRKEALLALVGAFAVPMVASVTTNGGLMLLCGIVTGIACLVWAWYSIRDKIPEVRELKEQEKAIKNARKEVEKL